MTDQEILTKAIEKAIAGGGAYWMQDGFAKFEVRQPVTMLECVIDFKVGDYEQTVNQQHVIFNHDFAKAIWGDKKIRIRKFTPDINNLGIYKNEYIDGKTNAWQYHLQQMVIAPNPIKYLGEHLDD